MKSAQVARTFFVLCVYCGQQLGIHCYDTISPMLPPRWEGDGEINIEVKEVGMLVQEKLTEDLEDKALRSQAIRAAQPVEDLYYHDTQNSVTVTTDSVTIESGKVNVLQMSPYIPGRTISLQALLPSVVVRGRYALDRLLYKKSEKEDGQFRWTLRNVTGEGVVFLSINDLELRPESLSLTYKTTSTTFMVVRQTEAREFNAFVQEHDFQDGLTRRLWRGVEQNLDLAMASRLTQKMSLREAMDEATSQRLQQYIITSTENANEFIDDIVTGVKKTISEKYENNVKIPDILERFEKRLLLRFHGQFTAMEGVARGLSSVYRAGETAFAYENGSNVHFYGDIGFKDISLFYGEYKASFMGLGPRGTLSTDFTPLNLFAHAYVDFNNDQIYLQEFRVNSVGSLKVNVSGLGLLNWLVSLISTWVVGLFRDQVISQLERKYDLYIQSVLQGFNLSDVINGNAFR